MDIRALQRELQANKKALEPKVSGKEELVYGLLIGGQLRYHTCHCIYACVGEDAV